MSTDPLLLLHELMILVHLLYARINSVLDALHVLGDSCQKTLKIATFGRKIRRGRKRWAGLEERSRSPSSRLWLVDIQSWVTRKGYRLLTNFSFISLFVAPTRRASVSVLPSRATSSAPSEIGGNIIGDRKKNAAIYLVWASHMRWVSIMWSGHSSIHHLSLIHLWCRWVCVHHRGAARADTR